MNKKITTVLSTLMIITMLGALVPVNAVTAEQVAAPYEFFAYVKDLPDDAYVPFDMNSSKNPSILYYDFDEGEGNESLNFIVSTADREITHKDNFTYSTTIYDKDGEDFIAWLGEPYFVVEAGGDWYLSKLLVDEDEDDTHLLRVGESLTLAGGFAITPLEIDVDGGEAWFSVTQDGEEVESSVTKEKTKFIYKTDLNESGEDDNWVLRFNVETVFAGMNTNLVKINKTELISPDVTLVESSDTDMFSGFKIHDTDTTLQIKFDSNDDEITLKKDGTVGFLDDRFNFKINEDGDVGGVLKIVEVGGEGVTETATVDANETATVDVNETATEAVAPGDATPVATTVAEETTEVATEPEEEPGFEAVFAIAGLLAVAYLVLRKRE